MKKQYESPRLLCRRTIFCDMIVTSNFGPNGEGIDFGGDGQDEEIAPHPSLSRGDWDDYNR